jgi:hypothetical protein
LREPVALFTLSYGRLGGCYSHGQEFQKTSENAEILPISARKSARSGPLPGLAGRTFEPLAFLPSRIGQFHQSRFPADFLSVPSVTSVVKCLR